MRDVISKKLKKFVGLTLALAFVVAGISWSGVETKAATTTTRVPITCYTTVTSNVTTYTTSALSKSTGYICSGDLCTIQAVYSNGSVKVKYPISGGKYKTAYASSGKFFTNVNFSTATGTFGKKMTAYRKSTGSSTIGTIFATDSVMLIGTANGRTQVLYPAGGSWKLGWVSGTYSISTKKTTNTVTRSTATIAEGYYIIKSAINTNYVLDINNASSAAGANLQIYQSNGTNAQIFYIKKNSDGYYTLIPKCAPKMAIDVWLNSTANGSNLCQSTIHYGNNQKWQLYKTSDGYYQFKSKSNGLFMDVSGGVAASGTNVWCYSDNLTASQKWSLVSAGTESSSANSNSVTYAAYTGVNYTNAGLSAARVACLKKAQKLATIQWVCPADFRAWKSNSGAYNKVKATDGTSSTYFVKGKTYVGIPYSMADHSYDDERWASLVKSGFTTSYMTTNYAGRTNTTAHGIDCSYLTYLCFKEAGTKTNVTYQTTSAMLSSSYYTKKSLSTIKGGDIALKSGHVMLYVGRSGSKYAFFEADASDSKVSYNTYTASQLSSYKIYKFKGFSD